MSIEYKSELVPIRFSLWSGTPKSDSAAYISKVMNKESSAGWRLHSQSYVSPPNWSGSYTGNVHLVFEREV